MIGGLIAGAIGGAGKAVEEVANSSIASRMKLDFERQMTDILATREQAKADIAQRLQASGADQQIRVGQAGIDAARADQTAQADKAEGIRQGLIGQFNGPLGERDRANIDLEVARRMGQPDAGPVNQLGHIESAEQRKQAKAIDDAYRRDKLAHDKAYNDQRIGLLGARQSAGTANGGFAQSREDRAASREDRKELTDHIKDNAGFFTTTDPLGGEGKQDLQVKQRYTALLKRAGMEQSDRVDSAMQSIIAEAEKASGGDPVKRQANIIKLLDYEMSKFGQSVKAAEDGKPEQANTKPAAAKTAPKEVSTPDPFKMSRVSGINANEINQYQVAIETVMNQLPKNATVEQRQTAAEQIRALQSKLSELMAKR